MKTPIITLTLLVANLAWATQDKKTVQLRLQSSTTGQLDQTTIYFDHAINPNYVYLEDAQKTFSGVAGVPVLWSVTSDNTPCSINGIGTLYQTEVVAIGADVDQTDQYFIIPMLLDNFDPTSIIRLEDKLNGTFHDLRSGAYTTTLDANEPTTGRFFLHVSTPASFSSTNAGCSDNNGSITVQVDNSITWTYCNLYDTQNNLIGSHTNVNSTVTFTSLPSGEYMLLLSYNGYTVTRPFSVSGIVVTANIQVSDHEVTIGEEIDFHALAQNANQFEWDFGDGTLIYGVANPTIAYYEPGTYTVKMKASNQYGCMDQTTTTVFVNEITSGTNDVENNNVRIQVTGKTITVFANNTQLTRLNVYGLDGRLASQSTAESNAHSVQLDHLTNGVYLVEITGENLREVKKVQLIH
ncbi:MAG: PKD domain-containing protein [Chitinophagales bacterium]|nr:PKD domain-containing protein [Chitinophagales bacterium]